MATLTDAAALDRSLAISNAYPMRTTVLQKLALADVAVGFGMMLLSFFTSALNGGMYLALSLTLVGVGIVLFAYDEYRFTHAGIHNNGVWLRSLTGRGLLSWMLGVLLTGFYVLLYWYPTMLGLGDATHGNSGLIAFFDPLSFALKNKPASQWFVYGVLYTLLIVTLGMKFIWKYRHNRYQVLRTLSVMFFQTVVAFLLPEFFQRMNLPYADLKNIFPLNYYFFFDWHVKEMLSNGTFGLFILFWGILSFAVITPILTYFYGKRWYCSWVCGCGGLAETAGDPFRHLSDKSTRAWQIERYSIYGVLVFALVMTVMVLYTQITGAGSILFLDSYKLSSWYGFYVGALFSGVVGVGFYPLMGSRVWCRFGCPMAAYLGILQKYFSRFRITVNGGQCISCGNCSVHCEMGIDVRAYAQRGQDIVRASCVGCGVCSAVCPRGVLRLENGTTHEGRTTETRTVHVRLEDVRML